MSTDNDTPVTPAPEASPETIALNAQIDKAEGENIEAKPADPKVDEPKAEEPKAEEPKKEKTHEEREIARLRRRVDNLTRRLYQGNGDLTPKTIEVDNQASQRDSETLTLSQQQLRELVEKEAKKLAPSITQQQAEIEHRRSVVTKLEEKWGEEKFFSYAEDLSDAFDGLADAGNRPKPATDAIFEADDPAALIEYLADPEHADEAKAIAQMSAVQAGRAVTKLETRIAEEKARAKPQPSKVPAPIEQIRGQGSVNTKTLADMSDDEFLKRRREQIAKRR